MGGVQPRGRCAAGTLLEMGEARADIQTPGPPPSTAPRPIPAKPAKRRRLWLGLGLTVFVTVLPWAGALIGYGLSSEPVETDLIIWATIVLQVICLFGWSAAGVYLLLRRLARRAAAGSLSGGLVIAQHETARALLAQFDMPCGRCGYNLRGLSAAACPECQEPVRLRLAGPDPMRPLVWLVRLALLGCLLRLFIEFAQIGAAFQPELVYYAPPGSWPQISLYLRLAKSLGGLAGLLVLVISAAVWLRANDSPLRAAARYQVLFVSVALPVLLGLLDLSIWIIRIW